DIGNLSEVTWQAHLQIGATTDFLRDSKLLVRRVCHEYTGSRTRRTGRAQSRLKQSSCVRADDFRECVSTFSGAVDRRQATVAMVWRHRRRLEYVSRILSITPAGRIRVCACGDGTCQLPTVDPHSHRLAGWFGDVAGDLRAEVALAHLSKRHPRA